MTESRSVSSHLSAESYVERVDFGFALSIAPFTHKIFAQACRLFLHRGLQSRGQSSTERRHATVVEHRRVPSTNANSEGRRPCFETICFLEVARPPVPQRCRQRRRATPVFHAGLRLMRERIGRDMYVHGPIATTSLAGKLYLHARLREPVVSCASSCHVSFQPSC